MLQLLPGLQVPPSGLRLRSGQRHHIKGQSVAIPTRYVDRRVWHVLLRYKTGQAAWLVLKGGMETTSKDSQWQLLQRGRGKDDDWGIETQRNASWPWGVFCMQVNMPKVAKWM